ncbi:unnamed protein product [Lactuca virosa]|uniref:Protein kinase domain-containing protein n=1 Tax=Lactuca virosa TaxID=75947 RepID=A0AAU9NGH7_9ASTR|nr:unnamed protein product [Lactuca virosa]
MSSLQSVEIDNNPFSSWVIPESLKSASTLQNFSAVSANITGKIPDFFGPDDFPGLVNLHLAFNELEGELPMSLSGSQLESLWVNGQKLGGKIDVIQNMTFLKEIWLHSNSFSGPLPDFSGLKGLEVLNLRDNSFTGPVPVSLTNLESLKSVVLTNNMLQGPMPKFNDSVKVDMAKDTNNFCLPEPGDCDPRIGLGLRATMATLPLLTFRELGLTGTISPEFSALKSLQRLVLANNNLTGTIPEELTTLPALTELDLANNNLSGKIPVFKSNLDLNTAGNPNIGRVITNSSDPNSPNSSNSPNSTGVSLNGKKKSKNWLGVVLFSVLGGIIVIFLIAILALCLYKKKQKKFSRVQSPHAIVIHPRNSGSDNESVKITVAGGRVLVHRNLVALLGYCLDGNEKLLVYEYMPQGTLSRHLFNWPEEGLNPLEWTRRLAIALDVARGVEYLHGLAQQSFIHRDLKPSNILLGDDMRAKVGDFGLVRLAPEGKGSIETRIAGTFGYLAPEYAITGRVTTKVDVFSFGVILMELITGRKALDESQPEESMHLVTWFRRMHLNKDTFRKSIDQTLDLTEENLASVSKAAELAGHCCAREPYQRPDMSHAVNVLSSLVEMWRPSDESSEDIYGIDLDLSLPQALKKWQAFEGGSHTMDASSSSFLPSLDNTQTSIPTRPYGFAESFTSLDGR